MKSRLTAGALCTALSAITSFQAGAAPITVINQSFEQVVSGVTPVGWTGGFSDPADPLLMAAPATGSRVVSIAANYGVLSTTIDTGYTILNAGDVFTLTSAIGRVGTSLTSADYLGLVKLQIFGLTSASNTAPTTESFVNGGGFFLWTDASVTYTATAPDIGKTVGIQLGGMGYTTGSGRRYFDNVRLDVVSVPEPSAGVLILCAAVGLLGLQRRRRSRVVGEGDRQPIRTRPVSLGCVRSSEVLLQWAFNGY